MNKCTNRGLWLLVAVMAGFSGALPEARASTFTWTGAAANDNWSTGQNWGGTSPGSTDTAQFNNGDANNINVVDTSRLIGGVVYVNTTGQHFTNLSGNTLTDNGDLKLAVDSSGPSKATIENGTLLVGSSSTRTNWMVSARPNVGVSTTGTMNLLNAGVTAFLNQFAVAYNPIFNNQTTQVGTVNVNSGSTVNIDAATSVAIGVGFNTTGTVTVASGSTFNVTTPALRIGSHDLTLAAGANGTLDLSAANASTLSATTVQVGTTASGSGGTTTTGTLLLGSSSLTATNMDMGETLNSTATVTSGSGSTIQIQSGGYLALAKSSVGSAQMTIGSGGTLAFGSGPSNRADFTVAQQSVASATSATATVNGALSGYIGALTVSNNTSGDNRGSLLGTLDNHAGTVNLDASTITVATGFNSVGTATFGKGAVTAGTVQVGDANSISGFNAGTTKGILSVAGTVANVTSQITVKDRGEVLESVFGTSSGLDMTNTASSALTINNSFAASNGGVQITFTQNPDALKPTAASGADAIFWGLKWSGNHVSDLLALWKGTNNTQGDTDDKLRWDASALTGAFSGQVSIFYDPASGPGLHTDATYIGFYELVPEPSTALLLGPGFLLIARRRNVSRRRAAASAQG